MPHSNTLSPKARDLWLLPLGGCGEIGMNMNLYGHDDQWLMVDCGVSFQREDENGNVMANGANGVFSADPSFIAARKDQLVGIVITHAHEDHVGAVAHLWERLGAPIYTTAFTAEFLRRKLSEAGLAHKVPVHIVDTKARLQIGRFDVEWLTLTHSIPEPQALVIRTPVGSVFHTADWKLDPDPVIGSPCNEARLRKLGDENITAMVCDSTNATVAGWSDSEGALYQGLKEKIKAATGRVVVACFGSNVARLITIARVALETDRQFSALGRSLVNMIGVAKTTDYWPSELKVMDSSHLGYLPKEHVLAVATGSQGEMRTALTRLANDTHFDLELETGDTVIFSSRVIPGNEHLVETMVNKLKIKGVTVILSEDCDPPIHASGHPHQDELSTMYDWVKPELAIPVHGEERHMLANAKIAKKARVTRQLTGKNGDLFIIAPEFKLEKNATKARQICLSRD